MEAQVQGEITAILEAVSGTSKAGKEWIKQTFVIDTKEEYDNVIAFEVFGEEKVDKLNKYNKVGDVVDVKFNIKCNEYEGRYFVNLQAWSIFKADQNAESVPEVSDPNPVAQANISSGADDGLDLPF